MKRMIVMALACCSLMAYAQQETVPEEVPWMLVHNETPEWYAAQIRAWEKVVAREPKNENAWFNLSKAMRYGCLFDGQQSAEEKYQRYQAFYERMGKAIPDTYTYHFFARENNDDSISAAHIERAYQLMPTNRTLGEEYSTFIAYFWRTCQQERLKEVAARYFKEQSMPGSLLRYNYNELQCLPENAIYFGNGDAILIPKMVLQHGMNVHQDKLVVCASFLCIP